MIALARKYRPRNFATVAVQTHVSNTLKGAIARGRVAHGYLLCGPRGVGKTTLARVLAMALNCPVRIAGAARLASVEQAGEVPDDALVHEAEEPCGVCESCTRIWSGGASLDVVEIDAASNRGVDDARELRERAMYAPSGDDRYKVYIVDEAHMLTREAWNALLKVLEEPPPRVVFVFATTEPQKIAQSAAPVLSRLQRFDFKRIGAAEIRERLGLVLREEAIDAESEALAMVSRAADGSMRDALSLTDQVLALGDGAVTTTRVREALGLVAEDEYLAILDLIAERRAADVFPTVARLVDAGVDLGQFLGGLGDMLRAQLAVALGAEHVEVSPQAREALVARRDALAPGDLLRMLNGMLEIEPAYRRSTQQQLLLETLLVRFALLDRTVDLESVIRELGRGRGDAGGAASTPRRPASPPRPAGPSAGNSSRGGKETSRTDAPVRASREDAPGDTASASSRRDVADDVRQPPRLQDPVSRVPDDAPLAMATTGAFPAAYDGAGAASNARARPARVVDVEAAMEIVGAPLPSAPAATAREVGSLAPRAPSTVLELNALVERWDDIVAVVRRERAYIGTLLEHTTPVGVSATGVVTLEADAVGAHDTLTGKANELAAALAPHVAGLTRVHLRAPNAARDSTTRMTAESVKSDALVAMKRRDPVLASAIDELDLDLI